MYECDNCGKEFSTTQGAFLGKVCPPMYDQVIICKECYSKILEEQRKRKKEEEDFLE